MLVRSICTPVHLIQLHPNPSNTVAPNIIFIPSPSDLIPSHPIASPSHPVHFQCALNWPCHLPPIAYHLSTVTCRCLQRSLDWSCFLSPHAGLRSGRPTELATDTMVRLNVSHPTPSRLLRIPAYPAPSRPILCHSMPSFSIPLLPPRERQGSCNAWAEAVKGACNFTGRALPTWRVLDVTTT